MLSSTQQKNDEFFDFYTSKPFEPFLEPARYKGAYGGRASGKTHFFGGLGVEQCYRQSRRMVCIREVQKDLRDSSMQVMMDKIQDHGLTDFFQKVQGEIRGTNGSLIIFMGRACSKRNSMKLNPMIPDPPVTSMFLNFIFIPEHCSNLS